MQKQEIKGVQPATLSVIVPVYNAAETLPQMFESVLNQSLDSLELICVDDGSADNSLVVLQEYAAKDTRVVVLQQKHAGTAAARNTGLAAATGEYVHFLDADDYVLPYAYEVVCNVATKHQLDMVRCASVDWDTQRRCFVASKRRNLEHLCPGDFNRLVGLESESPLYKASVDAWTGVFRRSLLLRHAIQFPNIPYLAERAFFAAAITNAKRTMIERSKLVIHCINGQESTTRKHAKYFAGHFRSIEFIAQRMQQDGISLEVQERVLQQEFNSLGFWLKRLAANSEYGTAIVEQTAEFVVQYAGPFSYKLVAKHRNVLRALAKTQGGTPKPARELPVFHKASAKPKVSVVVPIYNVEDYLSEALHSLTNQTMKNIEFVCVNDGSTDGSLAILQGYAALDKRFRILDGPNGGYGKAMNRGIDAARGEYLGILESDDFAEPTMFNDLFKVAKQYKAEVVKADFYKFRVNADGSLNQQVNRLSNDGSFYGRVLCPNEELQTYRFKMYTWSGIYKLSFIRQWNIRHNETPGAAYQDNGFWFQTFARAERVVFVDRPYYYYRQDNPHASMYSKATVVDDDKRYWATEEFAFIQRWLEQNPDLPAELMRVLLARKFAFCMVTYRRLTAAVQVEYAQHLYDEFCEPFEKGLLTRSDMFYETHWLYLTELMANPQAFATRVRVSVIMPVYNVERYLRQALDGLLARYELPFEVICVNDGSTDSSLEILREYESADSRVRVFTQENRGAGAARNYGMKYAKGDYLLFLDADDIFEPDMVRKVYNRALVHDADIVVFRSDKYIDATGQIVPANHTLHESWLPAQRPFAGTEIIQNTFRAFNGWAWDKLFRAEFIRGNNLQFQEKRTAEDVVFVYSAVLKAKRISTVNSVLLHQRKHAGSLMATWDKSWACHFEALFDLRQLLQEWGLYERYEQDWVNYALSTTVWNLSILQGKAYYELYSQLKSEWLESLGLTAHDMDYFYNQKKYRKLQKVLECSADEFLFWQVEQSQDESTQLRMHLRQANVAANQQEQQLTDTKAELRQERTKNKQLTEEIKALRTKNKRYRMSTSWKIGRAITWLPRKIKKLIQA